MNNKKELTINKKYLKYAGMLIVLLLCVFAVDALVGKDAKDAGKAAKQSVTDLLDIDFKQDIAGQLPPCTETGEQFWTMHLTTAAETAKANGKTIQSAQVVVNGELKPYKGLAGEGRIAPVQITITTQDKKGNTETSVSNVRVLMIKGEDGQWLLDGLAVDLPSGQK